MNVHRNAAPDPDGERVSGAPEPTETYRDTARDTADAYRSAARVTADAHRDGPTVPHGDRLGRYRLLQRIGEGGMGVVYLASDPEGQLVAVKVLRPEVAGDAVARRRLAREVETMRRVRDPRVAQILDADITGEAPYVATEYVPGRPLDEVVDERGPMRGADLTRLASGLARALAAIHAAGVVHRDLKPANVMLLAGEPVVIDFGIAQAVDTTRLTQTGMFIGTPGYLAPESIQGGTVGPAADIHAWAATVAFAATGRPPFGSGTYEAVFYRIVQGRPDLDGVPEPLLSVLRTALATDPRTRPGAAWLGERVAGLPEGAGLAAPAGASQPGVPAATRRLPAGDSFSDLLPPVEYQEPPRPSRPPPPAPPARPPYEPAGAAPALAGYRPLLSLALLATAVGLAAVLPVVGTLTVLVALIALRAADRARRALSVARTRRYGEPPSAGDAVMVALSTPWGLVRGAITTALLAPLMATVALVFGVVLAFLLRGVTLNTVMAYAAAAFVGLLCAGPGSRGPRRQTNRMLAYLVRDRHSGVVAGIALGTLAFLAVAGALSQAPVWWPLSPPEVMFDNLAAATREGIGEWLRDLW